MKGVDPSRLVFVDEAAANLAMSRSHAWIRRGQVLHDPRPMNWGTSMTMIGALRRDGWITMRTIFATANGSRFVRWVGNVGKRVAARAHECRERILSYIAWMTFMETRDLADAREPQRQAPHPSCGRGR